MQTPTFLKRKHHTKNELNEGEHIEGTSEKIRYADNHESGCGDGDLRA
jgi:hypothetical protein